MKLYEFESKEIVARYGIPVPRGRVVDKPEEALQVAKELGAAVLKAQVLVGGRGLAGGIKIVDKPEEALQVAKELLSASIRGERVERILVEEKVCIDRELYISLTVDRAARKLMYLVSEIGGVEIEELAKKYPEKIHKIYVDPNIGYVDYMAREALQALKLPWTLLQDLANIMKGMYKIMIDYDAELVEFNPLAFTCEGKLVALDAKIIIDDNSLYKHPELQKLYGREFSGFERKARELGVGSYVELDGDIGIICNGAGITMITMDLVYYYGGKPANFLDLGGGVTRERIKKALTLMLSHSRAKVILINIFAGFTKLNEVAQGIVDAVKEVGMKKPLIIRFKGTFAEEGMRILKENGITEVYTELDDAVKIAVELARKM